MFPFIEIWANGLEGVKKGIYVQMEGSFGHQDKSCIDKIEGQLNDG